MILEQLIKVLPIVGAISEAPESQDWKDFERRHPRLPLDYKGFISTFGSGLINDFITIYNPFSQGKANDWTKCSEDARKAIIALRRGSSDEYSDWRVFPEPEGLLVFGQTGNGDDLYWKTGPQPDRWTVACRMSRSPSLDLYPDTMAGFLLRLLTESGYCRTFRIPHRKHPFFRAVSFEQQLGV